MAWCLLTACNPDTPPSDRIPDVPVAFEINLNNPQYDPLNFPGSYVYIDREGFRGIIIWHDWNGEFRAFDRACSYHPYAECARIHVDTTATVMICGQMTSTGWQPCCESRFDMTGWPVHGPAIFPLKQYQVQHYGSRLLIQN